MGLRFSPRGLPLRFVWNALNPAFYPRQAVSLMNRTSEKALIRRVVLNCRQELTAMDSTQERHREDIRGGSLCIFAACQSGSISEFSFCAPFRTLFVGRVPAREDSLPRLAIILRKRSHVILSVLFTRPVETPPGALASVILTRK